VELPRHPVPVAALADCLTVKKRGRKAGLRFNPLERRFCPAKKTARPSLTPSTQKKGRIETLSAVRHYTLEELQQKHTPAGCLELKGCAIKLARVSEFLENLEQSGLFSKVRLVDSGTKRMVFNSRGDNSKQVVSFVLLAELASERKEARP
jgi:hypothetical protein